MKTKYWPPWSLEVPEWWFWLSAAVLGLVGAALISAIVLFLMRVTGER